MQVSLKNDFEALAKHIKHAAPREIKRATQASINDAAGKLAVIARAELVREIDPVLKGGVTRLVTVKKATSRAGRVRTSANIDFSEKGLGVENIKSTKIRRARAKKGRGASGRWNVTIRGQGTIKAFKIGADKGKNSPTFVRSKGKLKRLFAHTAVQSLFDEKIASRAPGLVVPVFLRLVDIFSGIDKVTGSDGRRR